MGDSNRGGMTVAEAGRLGGKRIVAVYGRAHMSRIGAVGGLQSPTRFKAGDAETARIASMGGSASGGNFANDRKRASEAGKKGGLAKAARRAGGNKG